jgi:DNA-binding NarL/FixJ family response regulator
VLREGTLALAISMFQRIVNGEEGHAIARELHYSTGWASTTIERLRAQYGARTNLQLAIKLHDLGLIN